MPVCATCQLSVSPHDLSQDPTTTQLRCAKCAAASADLTALHVMGRSLRFGFSYNQQEGFRAGARWGGATLTLHVDQHELTHLLGPEH